MKIILNNSCENIDCNRLEVIRFAIVGGGATVVHIGIAFLVCNVFCCISSFFANAIAFTVAFNISFMGHKYFTFNKSGSIKRFFIVSIVGFAINNIILMCLIEVGGRQFLSILISTIMVPVITYIFSKVWVFK